MRTEVALGSKNDPTCHSRIKNWIGKHFNKKKGRKTRNLLQNTNATQVSTHVIQLLRRKIFIA